MLCASGVRSSVYATSAVARAVARLVAAESESDAEVVAL